MDCENGKCGTSYKYFTKIFGYTSMGPVALDRTYEMYCRHKDRKYNAKFCDKIHVFESDVFLPLGMSTTELFKRKNADEIQHIIKSRHFNQAMILHYFGHIGRKYPIEKLIPSSIYMTVAKTRCPLVYNHIFPTKE